MARSSVLVYFLLAVLLFTFLGGDEMRAEAQQCIAKWDCNGGKKLCNQNCQTTYYGVGTCEDPTPNLCSCRYDC
ncbi:unnamed protein product [Linum tenue]|uniref:Uncharacterized protein n=1 Tax=Linum tenue TaxID=586396 RepID=A0AAV0HHF3_9ROSI|nr:unnamed protein product [Linum tenue]CAI0384403.1 unnamed protein product [Linum tenue]